jgi:hypothetical protein
VNDSRDWDGIRGVLRVHRDTPEWATQVLALTHEKAFGLPNPQTGDELQKLLGEGTSLALRPTLSREELTQSYIEHLEGQIKFRTRSEEWLAILRARCDALKPFVNKHILQLTMHCAARGSFNAWLQEDSYRIVHVENVILR